MVHKIRYFESLQKPTVLITTDCKLYMTYAFLLINCDQNKDDEVLKKLGVQDEIKHTAKVVGAFDIIAKINAKNQNELEQKIIPTLKEIKEIQGIKTLIGGNE